MIRLVNTYLHGHKYPTKSTFSPSNQRVNPFFSENFGLIALVWAFVLRDRSAPDSGQMSGYVGFRPLRFRTAPNFGRGLGRCDMTQLILNGLLKTDKVPA